MFSAKTVLKQYEAGVVEVDSRYDMTTVHFRELLEYSHGNVYEAIPNAFRFGYIQGRKSAGNTTGHSGKNMIY